MQDDDQDEGAQETEEERFARYFDERVKREQAERDKRKEPKNFGEFLDRLAGAVVDEAERRAEERNKPRDDDDEEPARGRSQGGFARWWQGEANAS